MKKRTGEHPPYSMTELELTDAIRGLAGIINRRQPRPTPAQRRVWADQLWAVADRLDVLRAVKP